MASGIKVDDTVIKLFNEMKVRKHCGPAEQSDRKKAVIFLIKDCPVSKTQKIFIEEGKEILWKDVGATVTDPYNFFVKMLPQDDCRYALYDANYETKESKKEELIFLLWSPEDASIKNKMIYASSKEALKKAFTGLKHEWQACSPDEVELETTLSKLGTGIISFEGCPCSR